MEAQGIAPTAPAPPRAYIGDPVADARPVPELGYLRWDRLEDPAALIQVLQLHPRAAHETSPGVFQLPVDGAARVLRQRGQERNLNAYATLVTLQHHLRLCAGVLGGPTGAEGLRGELDAVQADWFSFLEDVEAAEDIETVRARVAELRAGDQPAGGLDTLGESHELVGLLLNQAHALDSLAATAAYVFGAAYDPDAAPGDVQVAEGQLRARFGVHTTSPIIAHAQQQALAQFPAAAAKRIANDLANLVSRASGKDPNAKAAKASGAGTSGSKSGTSGSRPGPSGAKPGSSGTKPNSARGA